MFDLTVVMPFNKVDKSIFESIESVFYKSHLKIKLILIYNDLTREILFELDNYCKKFKDIIIVKSKKKGLAMSLAEAVLMAETEYVARIDSDDLIINGRFEKQITFLEENKDIAVVGSQLQFITDEGSTRGYSSYPTDKLEVRQKFVLGSQIAHPSVMFRKNAIIEVGNYQDFERKEGASICEDFFLWLRVLDKYEIANLPEVLTKYRQHSGQVSLNHKLKIEEVTLRLISIKIISQVLNHEFKFTYDQYHIYRKCDLLEMYEMIKHSDNKSFTTWKNLVRKYYLHVFQDNLLNFNFWESMLIIKKILLFSDFYTVKRYKNVR